MSVPVQLIEKSNQYKSGRGDLCWQWAAELSCKGRQQQVSRKNIKAHLVDYMLFFQRESATQEFCDQGGASEKWI